ncbi:MAG: hypothetical protein ISS23_02350 [Nanoarchaeota archaeon]|nr:hypothetical protein [Nanoarchaeota archaeon]
MAKTYLKRKYPSVVQERGSTIRSLERTLDNYNTTGRELMHVNPEELSLDKLDKQITDIKSLQKEISSRLNHGESFQKLRRYYMEKIKGKRYHPLRDLFYFELDKISAMVYGLRIGMDYTKQKVQELEVVIDRDYKEFVMSVQGFYEIEKSIKSLQKQYVQLQNYLGSPKCMGQARYKSELNLTKLERALDNYDRQYKGILRRTEILYSRLIPQKAYARATRCKLKLSEQLCIDATGVEEYLRNTIDIKLFNYLQNKLSKELFKIMDVTSKSILHLEDTVIKGSEELAALQNDKIELFIESAEKSDQFTKITNQTANTHAAMKEHQLKEFISKYLFDGKADQKLLR